MNTISILIVEDEQVIAMGIERMLSSWGYEIAESVMTGEDVKYAAGT